MRAKDLKTKSIFIQQMYDIINIKKETSTPLEP